MNRKTQALMNGLFLVLTLGVNALGALGIFNELSQKEVSQMYQTLITPSPKTFSIWSVIYILLIISVIMMIVKKEDKYYQNAVESISKLFWISSILNMAWIVAFAYMQIELSSALILAFLITLTMICKKLLVIHEGKRWLLPLAFGLYSGWLTIATVVNISAALVKIKWDGFGIASEIWTSIILVISSILVLMIVMNNKNAAYSLPVAWAYYGIYQQLKMSQAVSQNYSIVFMILILGIVDLIGIAAIQFYKNKYAILPDIKHSS